MPEREFFPEPDLVKRLLRSQVSDLGVDLDDMRFVTCGWDNAVYRLGEAYAVRLPVREVAVALVENEFRWVPHLAAALVGVGATTSTPVFMGAPGHGYPWPWLVCQWVPGDLVAELAVEARDAFANDLARALVAVHHPAPQGFPRNPYRGVSLEPRLEMFGQRIGDFAERRGTEFADRLRDALLRGAQAPEWDRAPVWLHGDPHPLNVLHRDGRLSGFIDFGDITAGDPASDIAMAAWFGLNSRQRERFREILEESGCYDDAVWDRAAGWAAALVVAIDADAESRDTFGAVVEHTLTQF